MSSEKQHYVNNADFLSALEAYHQLIKDAGKKKNPQSVQLPEYIGQCFLLMATNIATKPVFASYMFKEELIGDGIENCIRYVRNFKVGPDAPSKNPFSYFTRVIYNAFRRRIIKEKKQLYAKFKSIEDEMLNNNISYYGDEDSDSYMREFIIKFDDYRERKKQKSQERIKGKKT